MDHVIRETAEQRRESEAVANARQRVASIAASYGTKHPEFATGLNQLALLLIMQGDPESAEPLLRQALEIRRETLGDHHPDYATNLSSLGGLLWARGDLDEAEPLLRQAAEVRYEILGSAHPKTVVSFNSLEQLLKAKQDLTGVRRVEPSPEEPKAPVAPAETAKKPVTVPSPVAPSSHRPVASRAPVESAPARSTVVPPPETSAASRSDEAADAVAAVGGVMGVEQIVARLDQLKREFAGLGDLLSRVGEGLRNGLIAPSDDLSAGCSSARDGFARLCRDVAETTRLLSVSVPGESLANLADVSALLPSLHSAEAERARNEGARRSALQVLERIERIGCAVDPSFEPLAICKEQAHSLRRSIQEARPSRLPETAFQLADGKHPMADLLRLVSADQSTDDTQWADWFDSVVASFGNPLAVAIARSRISMGGP